MATVVNDLERSILLKEVSWCKKTRVFWLKKGDKCTKFFQ
jgi:hypothetical protein